MRRVLIWVTAENQTGRGQIKLPVEPELTTRVTRLSEGIPVDRTSWGQSREAAAGLGLSDEEGPA